MRASDSASAGSFKLFNSVACFVRNGPAGTSQCICAIAVAYMEKCLT